MTSQTKLRSYALFVLGFFLGIVAGVQPIVAIVVGCAIMLYAFGSMGRDILSGRSR